MALTAVLLAGWAGSADGSPDVCKRITAFGFRGPGLVQSLAVGDGLSWSRQFDGARRPIASRLTAGSDRPLFGEDHVWSARGQRQSTARPSENGTALHFDYDAAGRLTRARRAVIEGEQAIPASGWPGLPEEFGFGYDAADNLLSKLEQAVCEPETVSLPLDGSGRNRPGAIGETPLTWSENGNLVRAGDRRYVYDAKDRLVAVEVAGSGLRLAEYRYDAFDRRIGKTLSSGLFEETMWDGWQPIEVYRNGQLASRRTYGWGLDEVVSLEQDVDWAPGLEEELVPVYDETGNVVLLLRPGGPVVERYEYGPYGERWILVDSTPPAVEQVRTVGDELWIELSEEVRLDALEQAKQQGALLFTNLTDGSPVAFELKQPVERGRNARKRLVLASAGDPEESFWPEAGETASLTIPAAAFVDLFGNEATQGITRTFTATGAGQLLEDTTAPGVVQICVTADGKLEVTLDEEPVVAGWASAARVDGATLAWELQADRYTVRTTAPIAIGTHDLSILDLGPVDLDGKPLVQSITTAFEISTTSGAQTLYALPIPGEVEISTVGNVLGFHGLTHDPETDLVYVRNRYLDPRTGRFLTTDPMGYEDSVNLYQFALNDPVDLSDPTGAWVETAWDATSLGLGVLSFAHNLSEGNYGAATLDAVGIAVDAVATAVPLLPGGAGAGIKAIRASSGFAKLRYIDQTASFAQGVVQGIDEYSQGNYGWGSLYAGMAFVGARAQFTSGIRVRAVNPGANGLNARLVHTPAEGAVSEGIRLRLEYTEGMDLREFRRHANRLQRAVDEGRAFSNLPHGVSSAERYRLTRSFRDKLEKRIGQFFASNELARSSALRRLRASDIDHVLDLQLGGGNVRRNLAALDAYTNRVIGNQISRQLPRGRRVPIVGLDLRGLP